MSQPRSQGLSILWRERHGVALAYFVLFVLCLGFFLDLIEDIGQGKGDNKDVVGMGLCIGSWFIIAILTGGLRSLMQPDQPGFSVVSTEDVIRLWLAMGFTVTMLALGLRLLRRGQGDVQSSTSALLAILVLAGVLAALLLRRRSR